MLTQAQQTPPQVDTSKTCDILPPVELLPQRVKADLILLRRIMRGAVEYADRAMKANASAVDPEGLRAVRSSMKVWLNGAEKTLQDQGVKVELTQ